MTVRPVPPVPGARARGRARPAPRLFMNSTVLLLPTPYHINAKRRFRPRSKPSGGRPSQVVQRQKPLAEAERMA